MPDTEVPVSVARTPRVLWIELTSKCPFDCVFCSRQMRRGAGEHMPFSMYQGLLESLWQVRTVVLNYSGESTVYPQLVDAIALARQAGAFVELVSALAAAPHRLLEELSTSGLGRLTVSLHAMDPARYREIYRYASVTALREKLEAFAAHCRDHPAAPALDLAFVAMERNLDELPAVAAFGESLGIRNVQLFPVMRRDGIPIRFDGELQAPATPTESFRREVLQAVESAQQAAPATEFTIANPFFHSAPPALGRVPRPYPWPLPPGAAIHSCEQNPFETAHVLSNGDVVACEVLDRVPLGNLGSEPIDAIWNGAAYREFRRRYVRGEVPECRSCVWKRAYLPAPLEPSILASRGGSAQLLRGWHAPDGVGMLWSTQEAAAVLAPPPGARLLHVCGVLPPGPPGEANRLVLSCGSEIAGEVVNPWEDNVTFGLDFEIPPSAPLPWLLQFSTTHVFRPRERGLSGDQRDLGFALVMASAKRPVQPAPGAQRRHAIDRARRWMRRADQVALRNLPRLSAEPRPTPRGGVSILIPERGTVRELAESLAGATAACHSLNEAVPIVVAVNGAAPEAYAALRLRYPEVRWLFHAAPLGFVGAVRLGLRHIDSGWVYLLNSDVTMEPAALERLLALRAPDLFAAGSQIFFKDPTRFREETNLTALRLEQGLAAVHDLIPQVSTVTDSFYAGGGASLFRTVLLRQFVRESGAYAPFYWEDVEWGWRARKLGLRVLFCPQSVVYHHQRATIGKLHSHQEIETVIERNRLLFQLRNLTAEQFTERALAEVAAASDEVAARILSPRALWGIARSRMWNLRAPVPEEVLLAGATVS